MVIMLLRCIDFSSSRQHPDSLALAYDDGSRRVREFDVGELPDATRTAESAFPSPMLTDQMRLFSKRA